MSDAPLIVEWRDGVARLTLNRPERLNSFNGALLIALKAAIADAADPAVRAVLIRGAGRGFCAGQDLSEPPPPNAAGGPDFGHTLEANYEPLIRALRALDKPVLAAVNGVAAGAGASLALACDLVIAARSARFIQAFARIGLVPDAGATWFLPRLIGRQRAMGLALLGDAIDAEQAADWGLIWRCVNDADLDAEAEALAYRLAQGPTLALARTKQALDRSWLHGLDEQLRLETRLQRELGATVDAVEGIAAFVDKRAPRFTGR